MTAYATPTNMMLWFGAKELAEITGLDDLTPVPPTLMRLTIEEGNRTAYSNDEIAAADAALARLQAALDDAGRLMEAQLARRYTLPLDNAVIQQSPLPRICGDLARMLLQDDFSPGEPKERHLRALQWLRDLADGRTELNPAAAHQGQSAGLPVIAAGTRFFSDDQLKGFL